MGNGHDYISPEDNPMDKRFHREDKTQLKLALDKLTSRQREVFVMAVVDELSFREILRGLGINVRAVHDFYYAHKEFQGFCYTQVSDVQQEVNGLLNANRAPKFNLEKVKNITLNKKVFQVE